MSFSSIAAMLSAAQTSGQPLYAVIRDADCQENGSTARPTAPTAGSSAATQPGSARRRRAAGSSAGRTFSA